MSELILALAVTAVLGRSLGNTMLAIGLTAKPVASAAVMPQIASSISTVFSKISSVMASAAAS